MQSWCEFITWKFQFWSFIILDCDTFVHPITTQVNIISRWTDGGRNTETRWKHYNDEQLHITILITGIAIISVYTIRYPHPRDKAGYVAKTFNVK